METLTVKKGKTFKKEYILTDTVTKLPFPVSGWSLRGTIRDYPGAAQTLYEWTSGNLLLEDGKATVQVPHSDSELWTWNLGYYDIEMYNGTAVVEIDKGKMFADFEVTV